MFESANVEPPLKLPIKNWKKVFTEKDKIIVNYIKINQSYVVFFNVIFYNGHPHVKRQNRYYGPVLEYPSKAEVIEILLVAFPGEHIIILVNALRICLQSFGLCVIIPVQIETVSISNSLPHDHEWLGEEKEAAVPDETSLY